MKTFRQLKDTNNMVKTRLRKLSNTNKYYGMEKCNADKTNFHRSPYYLIASRKSESNWKTQIMSRFERVE